MLGSEMLWNLPPCMGGRKFFHRPSMRPTWNLVMRLRASRECSLCNRESIAEQLAVCGHLRMNFVCSVSANHVHNGLVSARMEFEPRIDFQDFSVRDYDVTSRCNHSFDISPREQGLFSRCRFALSSWWSHCAAVDPSMSFLGPN